MELNPKAALSGSLGLQLQGLNIRRHAQDIDIYLPYKKKFKVPDGFETKDEGDKDSNYPPDKYERDTYYLEGSLKIEVFKPVKKSLKVSITRIRDIRVVRFEDIVKFKFMHCFGDSSSIDKHRLDIIHMMFDGFNLKNNF